jgi:hypothetical protein
MTSRTGRGSYCALPRATPPQLEAARQRLRAEFLELHPADRQYLFGNLGVCPSCGRDIGTEESAWSEHAESTHNDD